MPIGVGHRPHTHYGHEGFKWKDDLPPDYTAEELRSYLPGKNVGVRFIEWYRQDVKGRGITVPFLKYSGPGNPTNIGEPVNDADKFAKIHDLEYAYAKFRHNNGRITDAQLQKETDAADTKFIKSNGWNIIASMDPREQLASIIGGLGIGVKYGAESVAGQIYPSLEKSDDPDIPTTSTNLANKLFKNLKSNISLKQAAEESGSMSAKAQKVAGGKRVETGSSGGEPSLPHKVASPNISVDPAAVPEEVEMASLTGTGKEQASGGASSDGMAVHYIERPFSEFSNRTNVYKKSHKFMTFGFAPNIINIGADTLGEKYLTSYLAEIPWHIPALYLNPSEFALLQDGAHVIEVSIEVYYRGSTIQFETNATSSGLATLNQINDIGVAHGLNRSGWGSNVRYNSFGVAGQPMIPSTIIQPTYAPLTGKYRGMVRDYYGANNNDTNFNSDIPKHQIGRQTFLYNYWANSLRGQTGTTAVTAANRQFGGWPCLAEKIEQMDGKTVVNQCVARSTYTPKLAPLKTPLKQQAHGLPFPTAGAQININVGGTLANSRQVGFLAATTAPSASTPISATNTELTTTYSNINTGVDTDPVFDIYAPIEKCQMGRTGSWGEMGVHIQPSIHIGVQPVPALTSAALLTEDQQFNNWTDTRAYWEVIATMKTTERNPTAWPYATTSNIPLGDVINWVPTAQRPSVITNPRQDGATFAALYTNQGNNIPLI